MATLHGHPFSTFVQRVRIALREKDFACEERLVDMASGEHKKDPYRALNPYGRVPTLEDDGLVLYESSAILEYLEELQPEPALLPADSKQRALARMHVKLCDIQFTRHVGTVIFPRRFLPEAKWDKEAIAFAISHIKKHLDVLDASLKDKEWLAGDMFSHAEIAYAPFLPFLITCDAPPPPEVERWGKAVLARESVEQTRPPDAPRWA